ncbi:PRC-barrel domain-containing protein [Caballeronia arvi]|uniref:PRC-barrel domain-containing protein n=1 Tax=Caballeronia arvi TaxID=1777135 RepID=A0A158L4Y4_9BURK|nr:PRC-barrel domain-containing protein [Caballeronia arvi]SAL87761.1 PRC-barrel domain-containing protein [Caballeronia arvi]
MKSLRYLALATAIGTASLGAHAQVAGTQPLSVTVEQSQALLQGWSTRKSILGKTVYNDKNEKIGSIKDLVIAPDATVSAAIVSTGGFLGVATHDVAVPISSLDIRSGNFYLAGATKEALKNTPEFEYNKVKAPPKPHKLKDAQ